jgi:hypothetical protein
MNYWFRLYTGILDDPKVQRLPAEQFKGWINILCLAKENDGLLPSTEDTAFRLRISEAEAQRLVEELAKRGLLDTTEEGITPHNWDGRQFLSDEDPTAAIRARRYRHNKRSVTDGVTDGITDTVTRDDTDASLHSETEQSRAETEAPTSRAKPRSVRRPTVCDEDFLEELQQNPAYRALNVRALFHKMVAWCDVKRKQPTRARLVNWLNREDPPMFTNGANPNGSAQGQGRETPTHYADGREKPDGMKGFVC